MPAAIDPTGGNRENRGGGHCASLPAQVRFTDRVRLRAKRVASKPFALRSLCSLLFKCPCSLICGELTIQIGPRRLQCSREMTPRSGRGCGFHTLLTKPTWLKRRWRWPQDREDVVALLAPGARSGRRRGFESPGRPMRSCRLI